MKIREFAESKGVSAQAIYKAVGRAGYSAKILTDRSGNITKKGLSVLRKIYPDSPDLDPVSEVETEEKDLIDRLKSENAALRIDLDMWQKRYFELVDKSNEERNHLQILIDQEQKLRAAAEHRGLIRRLFSGKKEKEGSAK